MLPRTLSILALALALIVTAKAEEQKRPAEYIQDNSFLIEEAYNQEEGVVQHILNVVYALDHHAPNDERSLAFIFTQEWPVFSQTHQFSYTIPYTFLDAERDTNGIG